MILLSSIIYNAYDTTEGYNLSKGMEYDFCRYKIHSDTKMYLPNPEDCKLKYV